jgi:hypothetical protein
MTLAATPNEHAADSASLILKLYELRTEQRLRKARAWFAFEFHPKSADDVLRIWLGPGHESAPYRMATTYWEMATSFVVSGAIDAAMFNAANTEHIITFVKLRPFLDAVRSAVGDPAYLANLERVVLASPNAESAMARYDRYLRHQAAFAAEGRQIASLESESATSGAIKEH